MLACKMRETRQIALVFRQGNLVHYRISSILGETSGEVYCIQNSHIVTVVFCLVGSKWTETSCLVELKFQIENLISNGKDYLWQSYTVASYIRYTNFAHALNWH